MSVLVCLPTCCAAQAEHHCLSCPFSPACMPSQLSNHRLMACRPTARARSHARSCWRGRLPARRLEQGQPPPRSHASPPSPGRQCLPRQGLLLCCTPGQPRRAGTLGASSGSRRRRTQKWLKRHLRWRLQRWRPRPPASRSSSQRTSCRRSCQCPCRCKGSSSSSSRACLDPGEGRPCWRPLHSYHLACPPESAPALLPALEHSLPGRAAAREQPPPPGQRRALRRQHLQHLQHLRQRLQPWSWSRCCLPCRHSCPASACPLQLCQRPRSRRRGQGQGRRLWRVPRRGRPPASAPR